MKQTARIIRNNVPYTLLSDGNTYGEPLHVSSVTAARLLPDPPPLAIIIGSTGETVTGTYYWDSASTATDDGETVIKVTAITTGRYKAVSVVSGGGGTGLSVATISALKAVLSSTLTDTQPATVLTPGSTWVWSNSTGSGFDSDDVTVVKPNDVLLASNGRWYNTAPAPVVPTIAALRLAVSGKQASISVQAYSSLNDGGGGVFEYDSSDTTSTDNSGTIIVAGTRRYKRRISGHRISAKWFGAVGDGDTVETTALRNAAAFVNDLRLTVVDGSVIRGTGGIYNSYYLYLPFGKYLLDDTVQIVGVPLIADQNTTLLTNDVDVSLLQIGSFNDLVQGVIFSGAKHAIQILGPNAIGPGGFGALGVNSAMTIRRCHFRYQKGPSIFHDTSVAGQDRALASKLIVESCAFETPCAYWGAIDDARFIECSLLASFGGPGGDVPEYPVDDDGNALSFFNSGDRITVNDAFANPLGVDVDNMPSWFQGTGHFIVERFRFGGESAMPEFRIRSNMTYGGLSISFESNERASVIVRDSARASTNTQNWLEVYGEDQFPTIIDVSGNLPSKVNEDPNSYVALVGSYGIWVHDDVNIYGLSRPSTMIRLDGEARYGYRFRQSADPTTQAGTDITEQMRQYFVQESSPIANTLYPFDSNPRKNLWFPDQYDQKQSDGTVTASNTGDGDVDTTLGLSLTAVTGVAADQTTNNFQRVLSHSSFPNGWGDGLPAGEYCFSCYVKAEWAAQFEINRIIDASQRFEMIRAASGNWSRVWFSFYHDGNGTDWVFVLNNIPQFQNFWIGMFQINEGNVPTPYLYPDGSSDAVSQPAFPSDADGNDTLSERRPRIYFRISEPTDGVWLKDDVIIKLDRSASDVVGWTCTTGGVGGSGAVFTPIGVGIKATSVDRCIRGIPFIVEADADVDEYGRVVINTTAGTAVKYSVEVPDGATITRIALQVIGGGNANLPAVMPRFRLRTLTIATNGTAATSAQVDSSANVGIYNAQHLIDMTGMSTVVDNSAKRYVIEFVSESGANATTGFTVVACQVYFTTTTVSDVGAA